MGLAEERTMNLETENEALTRVDDTARRGPIITRGRDAVPHTGRKQRGSDAPGFELHPAIVRGLQQFRETRIAAAPWR